MRQNQVVRTCVPTMPTCCTSTINAEIKIIQLLTYMLLFLDLDHFRDNEKLVRIACIISS